MSSKAKVIRYMTNEELRDVEENTKGSYIVDRYDLSKGWLVKGGSWEVFIIELKKDAQYFNNKYISFKKTKPYHPVDYIEVDSEFDQVIKEWEFKHNLTSNTLKTFEEIIDEL